MDNDTALKLRHHPIRLRRMHDVASAFLNWNRLGTAMWRFKPTRQSGSRRAGSHGNVPPYPRAHQTMVSLFKYSVETYGQLGLGYHYCRAMPSILQPGRVQFTTTANQ